MHQLRVLGGIDLRDPTGQPVHAVLAQPRRLALLAYLALANPGTPRRRDAVLGLLWPERDEAGARAALNKAVHFLRKALGAGSIVTRGAEDLAIDPAAIWCDVAAFRASIRAGDWPGAVAHWSGDLLPGFFIEQAGPFDEWMEGERAALRQEAASAARTLAEVLEREGEITGSVNAARRAVELAGHNERAVRELLELLDRLGDRAGALHAYERFAGQLAREFEAEPAPETQALVVRLRGRGLSAEPLAPRPPDKASPAAGFDETVRRELSRQFEIEQELLGGNMARVFLARERALQRQVVLKVLIPELGEGVSVERFRREIQVAAQLAHPNLVPVLTAGEVAGHPWYVMPYVAGATLRERLAGGALAIAEVLAILRDVADALGYAHARGIVHRDIKPGNVLLLGNRALVTDFGIAKAIADARMGAVGAPLTSAGSSLGTPTYMAPEQAAADPATDHRADIYSFGVMAWELLVGHPPFHGLAPQALLAAHMAQEPREVRDLRPEVPAALAELVMQCLAKDPAARPQYMTEVLFRLGAVAPTKGMPIPAATGRKSWARRIGIAAAVLAMAGFAAWRMREPPPTLDPGLLVVAPFVAEDGADSAAVLIAERLTQAITRAGVGSVVPTLRLREVSARLDRRAPDYAQRLARASGAGVLVSGSITGAPGRYELRTELVRMPSGRSVVIVDPAVASTLTAAMDSLEEGLVVAVVAHRDWGDDYGWGREHRLTRSLAAYRAAVAADEAASPEERGRHWRAALAADSMWPRAVIANGEYSREGAERGRILASTWPAGDRDAVAYADASANGEWEEAYAVAQRRLSVDSVTWVVPGVVSANNTQRHAEGARIGARRNLPSYWAEPKRRQPLARVWTAHVLHALGRFDEELAMADELVEVAPTLAVNQVSMRIAANAGLGNVDEVERLVQESIGLRDRPGVSAASASRAVLAAGELRAHGRPGDAVRIARLGLPWFEQRLAGGGLSDDDLDGYIDLLSLAEDWTTLLRMADDMLRRFPQGDAEGAAVSAASQAAIALTRLGQREAAETMLMRIDRLTLSDTSDMDLHRARALFAMNEPGRAMDAFRESYDAGFWVPRSYNARHRLLAGAERHAPFRALVASR